MDISDARLQENPMRCISKKLPAIIARPYFLTLQTCKDKWGKPDISHQIELDCSKYKLSLYA